MEAIDELYERITNKILLIRKINISACKVVPKEKVKNIKVVKQIDLFSNIEEIEKEEENNIKNEIEENKIQNVMLNIKRKYGKNAILKGMNLIDGATAKDRNQQIGGHHE